MIKRYTAQIFNRRFVSTAQQALVKELNAELESIKVQFEILYFVAVTDIIIIFLFTIITLFSKLELIKMSELLLESKAWKSEFEDNQSLC